MRNFLLLLSLFCSVPVFSQTSPEAPVADASKQKFSFGILGGFNIDHMPLRPDPITDVGTFNASTTSEHGFFAGVWGRLPISKRFAVGMDAQFVVKGYGREREHFTPALEHYQVAYLDFVPQVEYKVFKRLYCSLGGYGGIFCGERVKYSNQGWSRVDPNFGPLAEITNWGLSSGLRLEFGLISALVKYQHGLTPAIKLEITDANGGMTQASQFHRSLQIGMGYRLL